MQNQLNYSAVSRAGVSIISPLSSPVMLYFSLLLIGDEKSGTLWVQSDRELLFRQCKIHEVSCGTSTVELHNDWVFERSLKNTLTPKETAGAEAESIVSISPDNQRLITSFLWRAAFERAALPLTSVLFVCFKITIVCAARHGAGCNTQAVTRRHPCWRPEALPMKWTYQDAREQGGMCQIWMQSQHVCLASVDTHPTLSVAWGVIDWEADYACFSQVVGRQQGTHHPTAASAKVWGHSFWHLPVWTNTTGKNEKIHTCQSACKFLYLLVLVGGACLRAVGSCLFF